MNSVLLSLFQKPDDLIFRGFFSQVQPVAPVCLSNSFLRVSFAFSPQLCFWKRLVKSKEKRNHVLHG